MQSPTDYVSIALACGCAPAVRRWERELLYQPGEQYECEHHDCWATVQPGDGGILARIRAEALTEDDRDPRYHEDRPGR